uniref:hypothetical protein n=1 Tax=Hericium alpestre TaxID=135208 RepID=UPI002434C19A|nr:hypothetical protein QEO35_mgp24 [Hericium alpestre]WEX32009.1 hypothetical protein [Hericium alpestre]
MSSLIISIYNIIIISYLGWFDFNYLIIFLLLINIIWIILSINLILPNKYKNINELKLIQTNYYPYKYTQYWFENNNDYNYQTIFISIYKTIVSLDEFKLPINKKISLSFKNENKEYFLHRPLDLKNNITLDEYLELVKPNINQFYLNSINSIDYPTHFSDFKVIGIKIYFDIRNLNKQNISISKPGNILKRNLHTKSNNNNSKLAFKPIVKKK